MRGYRVMMILAVVCAVAAALLSVRTIQAYVGQVKVIAAAKDLSPDQVITANDLQWVTLPKGAVYRDAVESPVQAEGYVARGFAPDGTVLRQSMLEPGYEAGIPGRLAQLSQGGARYFAVALPENIFTTVGGQVHTGDRVDIYLTKSAIPLASDVVVLDGMSTTINQKADPQQGIVVAVTRQEQISLLPCLTQGSNPEGSLVLVLRPGKGVGQ